MLMGFLLLKLLMYVPVGVPKWWHGELESRGPVWEKAWTEGSETELMGLIVECLYTERQKPLHLVSLLASLNIVEQVPLLPHLHRLG